MLPHLHSKFCCHTCYKKMVLTGCKCKAAVRRADQVLREVSSVLDMLAEVYEVFGLTYKLALSTRPEGYLGTLEMWDRAEAALTDALNNTGLDWEVRHAIMSMM